MKSLYFIGILPPEKERKEVTDFKLYAAEKFNSHQALKSPPHITIHPPFWLEMLDYERLRELLISFGKAEPPFEVHLKNFNHFASKVVFVAVLPNPSLEAMQSRLKWLLNQHFSTISSTDNYPFHPHLTVAFKDLSPLEYERAWAYFSNLSYKAYFVCKTVVLLKHDGHKWVVLECFDLSSDL